MSGLLAAALEAPALACMAASCCWKAANMAACEEALLAILDWEDEEEEDLRADWLEPP